MITDKIKENANKVTFLVDAYPEHTIQDIIKLLEWTALDINTAIWGATALGFITEPDAETGEVKLVNKPKAWEFGLEESELEDALLFAFVNLGKKKTDLEENYLANYTLGINGTDVLIALRHLKDTKQIVSYDLEDPKDAQNVYTFFTLYENRDKKWGAQQFKVKEVEKANVKPSE